MGITLTKRHDGAFKELAGLTPDSRLPQSQLGIGTSKLDTLLSPLVRFPHHALDTYLPKLIRAGERLAICDQLDEPKQQKQEAVKEQIEPARGMRR